MCEHSDEREEVLLRWRTAFEPKEKNHRTQLRQIEYFPLFPDNQAGHLEGQVHEDQELFERGPEPRREEAEHLSK